MQACAVKRNLTRLKIPLCLQLCNTALYVQLCNVSQLVPKQAGIIEYSTFRHGKQCLHQCLLLFLQLRPLAKSLKLQEHDGILLESLEGRRVFCNCSSLSYTASEISPSQMEAVEAALTHAVQNLPKLDAVCLAFKAYNLWWAQEQSDLLTSCLCSHCVTRSSSQHIFTSK